MDAHDSIRASVPLRPPESRPTPTLAELSPQLPAPEELAKLLPSRTYLIEGFLGQGGMGAVYKAVQVRLNRPVAIKILQLGAGGAYDSADRFRREARAMAALSHTNIVNVFDFGTAGGKYLYIVMEHVDGSDLHQVMRAKQMTPELALYLVPQICDALAYAHEHGIVHRDIKPANIMLTRDWQVKVADFGLAKRLERNDTLVTQANMGMGTPDYAAPEQFEMDVAVDHRADIYALGVTFYHMLTGELPRGAWQPPSVVVKTDPRLDPIVIKAMMQKRDQRYQSARELQRSVIGFTQTLAMEQRQRVASAKASARLEAQKKARSAAPAAGSGKVPVSGTGKVPAADSGRARKGVGDAAATPGRTLASSAAKRRVIPIAIGAAALIAIGAVFLSSRARKGVDETPHASTGTPDETLASSATTRRPPIKVINNKPSSSTSAPSASSTFPLGQWVPVRYTQEDVSRSASTKDSLNGDALAIENGWTFLPRQVPAARNIAVRSRIKHPAEYKNVQLWLRAERAASGSSDGMGRVVLNSYVNGDVSTTWWDKAVRTSVSIDRAKGGLPMSSPPEAHITFAAVEDTLIALRNGKQVLISKASGIGPERGEVVLNGSARAEFRDIEVMILDGVPRERWPDFVRDAIPSSQSLGTSAFTSLDPALQAKLDAVPWTKFDPAFRFDASGRLKVDSNRPEGQTAEFKDGRFTIRGGYQMTLFPDTAQDMAVRIRVAPNRDENRVNINLRNDGKTTKYTMGRADRKAEVRLEHYDEVRKSARKLVKDQPMPPVGTGYTLEAFCIGEQVGVKINDRLISLATSDQVVHPGTARVSALNALIESIEYKILDGVATPAPLAQSEISDQSSAISLDAPGWKRLDLAKVKEEPGKVERLPDGAVKLEVGWIWTDSGYGGDVAIRARFRGAADSSNQRVMIREGDSQQAKYVANTGAHRSELFLNAQADTKLQERSLAPILKVDTTKTFTLELRAQGGTLTVLVDGKQVAQAQDDQLKFGRLGVFADRGIVEGIAYQAGDAVKQPGALVWKTDVGGNVNGPASQGADGTVFVATDNLKRLVALNAKDGSIKWKTALAGEPREGVASVIADDGGVLIVVHGTAAGREGKGVLHCIDGASGKERWTFAFDEGGKGAAYVDSSVAVPADGKVFLQHKAAYCIDLASGGQLWTTSFPSETSHVAPAIAANGTVIFPAGAVVLAMNPLNGGILWQSRLTGGCYGDPAVDGTTLFVAGVNSGGAPGSIRAYDIASGQMRWENKLGEKIDAGLALDAQGRVFTCNLARHVIACDAATGAKMWEAHQGSSRPRGFTIGADGLVYTSFDKDIVCLKPDNGEIVWRVPTNDSVWGVPLLLDDGLLITGSRDHNLYAIQTSSRGLADSPWPTMGQNNRRNGRAKGAQIVVAEDTPTDKKLRGIEAKARAEYDAGPGKVFADASATLRAQYANALKARAAQSQKEGLLEAMLAFNEEAGAFASGKLTAPPADAPDTFDALRQMRGTFRKTMGAHEASRDKAAAPIYAKWDAALAGLQTELTKAGEINEALRVKKLRDQIVATRALTIPAAGSASVAGGIDPGRASATTRPGSLPPAKITLQSRPAAKRSAPAPKLAKVDQRKLAEWVLSIPGSEIQYLKSDGKTRSAVIKKAADLPNNEIELAKVMLGDAASAKETDLLQITSCPRLAEFRIQSNGFNCITPAVIAALGSNDQLKWLDLHGVNLEDADFAPLARCKELIAFRITDAPRFTGQALSYLPAASIEALELRNCPVKDDALQAVARMAQLVQVNFDGLEITESVFDRLPAGKLTNLRLSKMPQLKGKVAAVKRFPKVESLDLGYWSGLNVEEATTIAALPNLRRLGVTGITDNVLPLLAVNKHYERLSLQPSGATPTSFKSLSVFSQHRRLKELALIQFTSDETLEAVATLQQLERLELSQSSQLAVPGMSQVAKLARLTKLDLDRSPVTDAGLEPLKALKKLEELDLTGTKVTSDGVAAIKKALPKCRVLGP